MTETAANVCISSGQTPFHSSVLSSFKEHPLVESASLEDGGFKLKLHWKGDAPGVECMSLLKQLGYDLCRIEYV